MVVVADTCSCVIIIVVTVMNNANCERETGWVGVCGSNGLFNFCEHVIFLEKIKNLYIKGSVLREIEFIIYSLKIDSLVQGSAGV